MKYISRRYLSEKWKNLKWDMENALDVCGGLNGDSVSEEDFNNVKNDIKENMRAIWKEFGFDD